jgi:hypothetical protein
MGKVWIFYRENGWNEFDFCKLIVGHKFGARPTTLFAPMLVEAGFI